MMIQEFQKNIEDMTEEAIKKKWNSLLSELKDLDPVTVKELMVDYFILDGLISAESDDMFGTEGMNL